MEQLSPPQVASFSSALEESESLVQVTSLARALETVCVTEIKDEERHDSQEQRAAKRKFSEGTGEQFRMFKRPCRDHIGTELSSPMEANSPSSPPEDCKFSTKPASLTCSLETMYKPEVQPEERHEFTEQRTGKRKYDRDIGEQLSSSKRHCGDHTGTSGSSEDNDDDNSAVPTEQTNKTHYRVSLRRVHVKVRSNRYVVRKTRHTKISVAQHLSLGTSENTEPQHPDTCPSTQTERPKLVLDLDNTLLNTTEIFDISLDEVYLIDLISPQKANGLLHRIDFEDWCRMVKLRPFVHEFLQEADKMFDLYIYTMGSRTYAKEVVKRLDPENRYFSPAKVIARTDYSRRVQKSLSVIPASRTRTIIIDDKRCVWKEEDRENVIEIKRYNYFSSTCQACHSTCKSLAELRTDESSANGNLAAILSVLKCAYEKFEMDQQRGVQPDFRRILKDTK